MKFTEKPEDKFWREHPYISLYIVISVFILVEVAKGYF